MSIREAAVQAYQEQEAGRVAEARAVLADVLAPFDVSGLDVAHIDVTSSFTLIVFTDGDVHLGVCRRGDEWTVNLVADEDGWTDKGAVTSLAELGRILPPASVAAWTTQFAYAVGARVSYNGETFEAIQAHTSQAGWEPPNVPALWVKV
jgi:hypothetical protein